MYVNFKLLETYGLIPEDVVILTAIKQNRKEDMSKIIESICNRLDFYESQKLVNYIKGNKTENKFKLIRTTSKCNNQLDNIGIPKIIDEDIIIADWMKYLYLKSGKQVGNFENLKLFISLFRVHTGIERNWLSFLIKCFINDEKNFEFSHVATYLFWKPENIYQTKKNFTIGQSRLYQYYESKKEFFDKKFELIEN